MHSHASCTLRALHGLLAVLPFLVRGVCMCGRAAPDFVRPNILADFPLPPPVDSHVKLTELHTLSPKLRFRAAVRCVIRNARAERAGSGAWLSIGVFSVGGWGVGK
jgi:hypothetical protein